MISDYAFIFLSPGADSAADRRVLTVGGQRSTLVAVAEPAAGVAVAAELARAGAQLIELCGAFGPATTAQIVATVGPDVVVGAVGYPGEVAGRLAALTSDDEVDSPR